MTATVDDDSDVVWAFRRYLADAYTVLEAYDAAFVATLRAIDTPRATGAPLDG